MGKQFSSSELKAYVGVFKFLRKGTSNEVYALKVALRFWYSDFEMGPNLMEKLIASISTNKVWIPPKRREDLERLPYEYTSKELQAMAMLSYNRQHFSRMLIKLCYVVSSSYQSKNVEKLIDLVTTLHKRGFHSKAEEIFVSLCFSKLPTSGIHSESGRYPYMYPDLLKERSKLLLEENENLLSTL